MNPATRPPPCAQLSMPGVARPMKMFIPIMIASPIKLFWACLPNVRRCRRRNAAKGPDDAEDRAARARRDSDRVEQIARDTPGQAGEEVYEEERRMSVRALHGLPEYEEREGVEPQVHEAGVEEHRCEQPPVFPLGDEGSEHGTEVEEHIGVFGPAREVRETEHDDVDGEQSVGEVGPARYLRHRDVAFPLVVGFVGFVHVLSGGESAPSTLTPGPFIGSCRFGTMPRSSTIH